MNRCLVRLLVAVLLLALSGEAKTRNYRYNDSKDRRDGNYERIKRRPSAQEIERTFRPYLEERIKSREGGRRSERSLDFDSPAKNDYYALMRYWDELSIEFRALYKEATNISRYKDYDYFISPKGKFKILYTTSGTDSVDITDKFSYGSGQQWNERSSIPNGVPDYIDEAAFALDSAYTMMVERFGFNKPLSAPDPNGNTDYYTVVIARQARGYYGITQLGDRDSDRGFKSHIEINSDWSGREWADLGYNERPLDALRVTCAHELFHAIQYAISWNVQHNVYLDDFSLGWTEGGAVLMEDIAFPEVKDYIQYVNDFFDDPADIELLGNDDWYLNGIIFKYLYEKTYSVDSIGFIKTIYDKNSAQRKNFHENIEEVSQSEAKKTWAQLLNSFHAESYFTGNRARPQTFVADSKLMSNWRIPAPAQDSTVRTVKPYSTNFLLYEPLPHHPDTLILHLKGTTGAGGASRAVWAASVLVMEQNGGVNIVPAQLDGSGEGSFVLADWKNRAGALLVVTNANRSSQRITVNLRSAPLSVYPNVISLKSGKPVRITGGNISDVKIYAINGRLVNQRNGTGRTQFIQDGDALEWKPLSSGKGRLAPGVYFVTVSYSDPVTLKKSVHKRKIMITP